MTERGFNNADSTVKEMIDFFETRVEIMEPKEDKKNLQQLTKNPRTNKPLKKNERTPFQVSKSQVKNRLWSTSLVNSAVFCMENVFTI